MTTTDLPGDDTASSHLKCGCCGRTMPAARLTELGDTPGVHICAGRDDGYLVTHAGGVEVHFSHDREATAGASPARAFIHVQDTATLWKHLKSEHAADLEPLQDQDYGLREFAITDPDGNRIRIGSPLD